MKKLLRQLMNAKNPIAKKIADLIRIPPNLYELFLLSYYKNPQMIQIIKKIRRHTTLLLTNFEAYQLLACAVAARKLPGDYAEVGVFEGASAQLICEAKGEKNLLLFDTFEGLPKQKITAHDALIAAGQYASNYEMVQRRLSPYKNVKIYKGIFPDAIANLVNNSSFAFVHLDVDIYKTMLDCLSFFYPRMVRGGIILSHDYNDIIGVKAAFQDFFSDKDETIIELATSQCVVIKL
ncbi:MAG: TylF/MycF/NovP-related O-methyltransferase [Patescibacteria group bacterium]